MRIFSIYHSPTCLDTAISFQFCIFQNGYYFLREFFSHGAFKSFLLTYLIHVSVQNGTKESISKLVSDLNSATLEPEVGESLPCQISHNVLMNPLGLNSIFFSFCFKGLRMNTWIFWTSVTTIFVK